MALCCADFGLGYAKSYANSLAANA
ncbi:MAG: hypothetical protein RIQ35_506, partial [Pseudomonadota bacterium]